MSLRLKLLLLGLATLVLPWAGCNYAREMESALRQGEQNSLQAVSQTIAASLQGRTDLLYRTAPPDAPATEEPAADESSHSNPLAGNGPESGAAQGDAPQSNTAQSNTPQSSTPQSNTPQSDTPQNNTPQSDTPQSEASQSTAPQNNTRQNDASRDKSPPDNPAQRGPYDLAPLALTSAPPLDGYSDDWPHEPTRWVNCSKDANHRFRLLSGVYERMLYLLLEVHDEHPVFDGLGTNWLDAATYGDRVWIGYQDPRGEQQQVFLAATGPGSVSARRIAVGEYGQRSAELEPRVHGAWQTTSDGYRIEVRLPLSMLGSGFGVLVDDRDARGAAPVSYGTLRADDLHTQGRLIVASPDLSTYLAQFLQPGLRIAVLTPADEVLSRADALTQAPLLSAEAPLLARLYRRFVDRPGERQVIASDAPIYDRDHLAIIGRLEVTQTADRWIRLRDHALTRMLNFTLISSAVLVGAMFAFAAWLALRLARLRRASESALTRTGLITSFPETSARDELGDVARGFSTLLGRLNEYTSYLRTLAGKLAHEIRTPLTIVRSSLDNLEAEQVGDSARTYLARARQGSERLSAILLAMGAATRVEEAIGSAERVIFDLVPLLDSTVAAYRGAFPGRTFEVELPAAPVTLNGAPDLIVQMLDKLIDNAVDFSPAQSPIIVRLSLAPQAALIEVENRGASLPAHLEGRLFESLWQSRPDGDSSRPHFGLGLYIVRLIAEFHDGEAFASNLPDGGGVRIGVRLAR